MASSRTALGLLLKSADTGDADRAVTLLTAEHGRFGALARHARASKRRFGPALQPFCLFEAAWKPRSGALAFLESAHAVEFPLGADPGLDALGSAYLFLELAQELCPLSEPQPAFFELVLGGLRRLGKGAESAAAVRLSVLWGALSLAGLAPSLEACAVCGRSWPLEAGALAPSAGGALCANCAPGRGGGLLDQGAWEALLQASQGQPQAAASPRAEEALLGWLAYQLGRPLRTADLTARLNGDSA
jgi:DNA repair protein RecO (recombination protein O)